MAPSTKLMIMLAELLIKVPKIKAYSIE